jgi:dihydroorotate dehydrogenase
MVSDIKAEVADNMSINACGGISTTEDAWLALQSGATTVQLYTGMVYQGPGIAKNINQGLARLMEKDISGHTPS